MSGKLENKLDMNVLKRVNAIKEAKGYDTSEALEVVKISTLMDIVGSMDILGDKISDLDSTARCIKNSIDTLNK